MLWSGVRIYFLRGFGKEGFFWDGVLNGQKGKREHEKRKREIGREKGEERGSGIEYDFMYPDSDGALCRSQEDLDDFL